MKGEISDSLLQERAEQNHMEKPCVFPHAINELLDILVEIKLAEHGNGPINPNRENQK